MSDRVRVLVFAAVRDAVGAPEVTLELPVDATAGGLLRALCERYPALGPYAPALRVAVNGEYVREGDPVREGDEVAVIPPVAGG
jgi:molybdopterin converting factor subunit 1